MKISMQLLLDHCKTAKGTLSLLNEKEPEFWYQLHHYDDCWLGQRGVLLFSEAEKIPEQLTGQGIIAYGKPADKVIKKNNVLWFETTVEKEELYIYLQNIILTLNDLDEEMNKIVRKRGNLQELTEKAAEMFGNPVLIYDQDFYRLAAAGMTGREHAWDFDKASGQYRLPYEIINDFNVNADYIETMTKKKTSVFPEKTFGYRSLYRNLWYHGEYRGRVLVDEINRPICKSDYELLDYFTELVKEYFRSRLYMRNPHNYQIAAVLEAMLSGEMTETTALSATLSYTGWTREDDYFCAVLFPQAGEPLTHAMQYHCNVLSEKLEQSCAFEWENRVVLLLNATVGHYTVQSFQEEINGYLREGLMKAGVSSVGNNLNDFVCYYEQAVSAYETGRQKDPSFWSYTFDNYRTDYVIRNALLNFPAQFLCSPEIYKLREYDSEHTSELEHTLRTYLMNERALLKTAEELEIHRTTLLYRIRRIEEITGLNLDEEKSRFALLLSFHIMDVKLS